MNELKNETNKIKKERKKEISRGFLFFVFYCIFVTSFIGGAFLDCEKFEFKIAASLSQLTMK
jgi:hypothetical protein